MFVSSHKGTALCVTFLEYRKYMEESIHYNSGNEIWCSSHEGPEDFPCLAILVKGDEAVVNYFSENNAEMFASLGDTTKDGIAQFQNGQYEVMAYQVISSLSALECALQFFHSQEKPSCIEWEEL